MTYEDLDVEALYSELAKFKQREDSLVHAAFNAPLKNSRARNFLEQGFLRRLKLISLATQQVFEILPPETRKIPTSDILGLVTIQIHAQIFNTFGALDCWAHVWATELGVQNKKGKPLLPSRVGIGKKYSELRQSLPKRLDSLLCERDDWLTRFSDLRHALAHQIPPYIPPYMVDPSNEEKYNELNFRWYNSLNPGEREQIDAEIIELAHFKAFLIYDLDKSPPIGFHAQLISDFLTLEEISLSFVTSLYENAKHTQ